MAFRRRLSSKSHAHRKDEEVLNRLRQDMTYDVVTMVLWERDQQQRAKDAFAGLRKLSQTLQGDAKSIETLDECMQSFEGKSAAYLQDLRAATKGTSRLIRQFSNLPLGVQVIAALDDRIVHLKRQQQCIEQAEAVLRRLESKQSSDSLRGDEAEQVGQHFSKIRKDFAAVLANAPDGFVDEHPAILKKCEDRFMEAVVRISSICATEFDTALFSIVVDLTADPPSETLEQCCSAIEELSASLKPADTVKVGEIGDQDIARDWVAKSIVQKRFLSSLSTSARLIYGGGEEESTCTMADVRNLAVLVATYETGEAFSDILSCGSQGSSTCDPSAASLWVPLRATIKTKMSAFMTEQWLGLTSNLMFSSLMHAGLVFVGAGLPVEVETHLGKLGQKYLKKLAASSDSEAGELSSRVEGFVQIAQAVEVAGGLKLSARISIAPVDLVSLCSGGQVARSFWRIVEVACVATLVVGGGGCDQLLGTRRWYQP